MMRKSYARPIPRAPKGDGTYGGKRGSWASASYRKRIRRARRGK